MKSAEWLIFLPAENREAIHRCAPDHTARGVTVPDSAGFRLLGIKPSPGGPARGETEEGQNDNREKKDEQENDFRRDEGGGR